MPSFTPNDEVWEKRGISEEVFANHTRYPSGFVDWLAKFSHVHNSAGLTPLQVGEEAQSKADFIICVLPNIYRSCKLLTKEFAHKGKVTKGSFHPDNLIPVLKFGLRASLAFQLKMGMLYAMLYVSVRNPERASTYLKLEGCAALVSKAERGYIYTNSKKHSIER